MISVLKRDRGEDGNKKKKMVFFFGKVRRVRRPRGRGLCRKNEGEAFT